MKPEELPEDIFIKAMGNNIKKAVFEVVEAGDDFITPRNPAETFTEWVTKNELLDKTIEAEVVKKNGQGLAYYKTGGCESAILALTQKIVSGFYTKFHKIYQAIWDHRYKSGMPTNAVALAHKLKVLLAPLASPEALNELDKDLNALESLLDGAGLF